MPLRSVSEKDVPRRGGKNLAVAALAVVLFGLGFVWLGGDQLPLASARLRQSLMGQDTGALMRVDSIGCAKRSDASREVAVLDFKGGIGDEFDSDAVYALLNRITNNSKIGAIALRVDSAGGNSYVAKKLHEVLLKAKQTCALPMAAFIGNVGTSGGYWLATAADEIHADPLSTIGAVGVIAIFTNEREKFEKEGIKHSVVRTGERKWPLMPYLPVVDDDVQKIKDSLEVVLAEYVAAVESSRQGKLRLTRDQLTTGEAWMGRDALKLGLVDAPESIESASARLLGGTPTAYRLFDLVKGLEKPGTGSGAEKTGERVQARG